MTSTAIYVAITVMAKRLQDGDAEDSSSNAQWLLREPSVLQPTNPFITKNQIK